MSSPPPAPGHTRDFEELAGLAALRALEGDELSEFERHAQACPRCRAIERADREAVLLLGLTAPEMDALPGSKERLMQRAAAELAERRVEAPREPLPMRPRILLF